jgi:Kef-type K+ transport system membrane component KefB
MRILNQPLISKKTGLVFLFVSIASTAYAGGGNSGLVLSLGALLGGAAILSILFTMLKQSNILAFIGIGIIAGLFRDQFHLPRELLDTFTTIGIILLLFMAGLELDLKSFLKRWKIVLVTGLGQIIIFILIGIGLGKFVGIEQLSTLIYFSLCITLSSTIIVLGTLKSTRGMESFHGQVILGLMVLQDIVAVVSLSILNSLASPESSFGVDVALIFGKMAILVFFLVILEKLVLGPLFKFFARSAELLFIGTLGYCMGIAALCAAVDFSPEIGAFLAGVSLSALPYKLEIEDKVDPLKTFGIILFFITLGFNLEFNQEMVNGITPAIMLTVFVVFVTPIIMITLGYLTKLKSHPAFMIGGIINQISEFSLILATLCLQAGVFSQREFVIITLTCLGTFFLSSLGHQFLDNLYLILRRPLHFVDRRSRPIVLDALDFELENHIVLLSYNEISEEIADFYAAQGEKVLLIDLDPEIHSHFHRQAGHHIVAMYADMQDPDIWHEFAFEKAKMVISCMIGGQDAEIQIARYINETNPNVPFLATTDSHEEALELYEKGIRYVIQTEYLAAVSFRQILREELKKEGEAFVNLGKEHHEEIKHIKENMTKIFKLV